MTILLNPWFWLALALTAAAGATKWALDEKAAFDSYRGGVEALGRAADQHRLDQIKLDQQRKELADAETNRLKRELADRTRELRNARAGSGFVPAASAPAGRPGIACFDAAELERAIRTLDSGVQGFLDEGSQAELDLDVAKRWAQNSPVNVQ